MDALALLCTLHADGPTTLKRLRQSECHSIEFVIALDVAELARLMRTSEPVAERFRREAQGLRERISGPDVAASEGTKRATTPRGVDAPDSAREKPISADEQKRRALERVLSTWRERDAENDSAATSAASSGARAKSSTLAIEIGAVDGLDAAVSRALADADVSTLRELASGDALAIARASGLAYSRVVRLRALAQREIASASAKTTNAFTIASLKSALPSVAVHAPRTPGPKTERAHPEVDDGLDSAEKVSLSDRPIEAREPLGRFNGDFALRPALPHEGAGGPFA